MATIRTVKVRARCPPHAHSEPRIDLPAEKRKRLIGLLNEYLANTFGLYGQAKQARWNVKGPQVDHLHRLFDESAE